MRTALPGLLAVTMAASTTAVPYAAAGPVVTPALAPAGATVTLLTGDVVTVSGTQVVSVRPAKGREHIAFHTHTDERGAVNVVPEDARAPLAEGKLDPRLFDVTELVESGYDDAKADRLPLIVDHAGPTPFSAAASVSRELPTLGATAVTVERSAAYWPTALQAEHVWLDGRVRASLEHSVPQIGAPAAWGAGHTGAGSTVAVLDTGIDTTHPDLAGAVVGASDFTGSGSTDDRQGHGTHVASIITGAHDRYRGVAPDTRLLNGKVLDDSGSGTQSSVLAGMEWAAAQGADVISMSLGGSPSDGTDPLSQAVNRLTAETGALFVIAAGNEPTYVSLPGTADAALTVGAVDRDDEPAEFSGRGPRAGDGAIKPDITAPGVDIVAARATNGALGEPGQSHIPLSGTSMATPHVAGAAAILAGAHPDWSADRLKAALMGSAVPKDGLSVFEQGAGRVDVAAADKTTLLASPTSLSLGTVRWPHDDNEPISRTLTYTNLGTAPVTLDLAADVVGEDGSPVPQGTFTLTPATLTVPAGGQASATVTADTSFDGPVGTFSGVVTASPGAGGRAVRTPIAVAREVESYDVDLRAINYDGTPSEDYSYRFVSTTRAEAPIKDRVSGPTTVRLPRGEYTYTHQIRDPASGGYADFVEPTFTLTGDTELVLDARETVPIDIAVDEPTARHGIAKVSYERMTDWGPSGASWILPGGNFAKLTTKPSTTRHDGFTFTAQTIMAKWNGESFDDSPYLYHLRHTDNGVPQAPRWQDRQRDLARVRSEHATSTPGSTGIREFIVGIALPGALTEYYTPDVPWELQVFNEVFNGEVGTQLTQYAPMTFRRGKTTTVRWNIGVFGPSVGDDKYGGMAFRGADQLFLFVSPYSDQGPGRLSEMRYPGKTQLLRGGEVIGETDWAAHGVFEVGPERAVYTLRSSLDRSAQARLSTRIDVEWTFTSQRSEQPASQTGLSLLGVRYAPELDDHNAAPAGKRYTIPVAVQRSNHATPGEVSTPAIEISYDDGKSWKPASVKRKGDQWAATVDHPSGAQFVSLRSVVANPEGDAQRLTIIRAYALK